MKKKLLILYASVGIIILVCLICMTLNRKKQNQTEPVSTELNTDVTTESVSEMSTEQDNSESESESITLSEDNYIETIKQIISGQTNSQTPVTKACLASFDSADLSGIISITEIPEMCSYADRKACFNITTSSGTKSYAAGFTIVNGKMNYLEIYYVPGAEGGV
jgi:hypothetical protein|uniref:hypothetical protein n=1 Tax=Coprococcus sp. TaxID=2049024 RepID=UPI003FF00C34